MDEQPPKKPGIPSRPRFKHKKNSKNPRSVFRKKKQVHPNTLANLQKGPKFQANDPVTGQKDERINRNGPPKTTLAARRFFQEIGEQLVKIQYMEAGKEKEKQISLLEHMVFNMYTGKAPLDHQNVLKASFPGILDDEAKTKGPKEFILRVVYEDAPVPDEADLIEEEDQEEVMEGHTSDELPTMIEAPKDQEDAPQP